VKESRSPESHHAIVAPRTGPSQSKTIKPSWCASASSQANGHLALLASNRNLRRHINDVPSASPAKRVASPCAQVFSRRDSVPYIPLNAVSGLSDFS
jgi:hypothetical protein